MYTNIPITKAKDTIREYFYLIKPYTGVPLAVFLECVAFFTEHSTYFLYKSQIYRQTKGLAMGNMLSQILPEIVNIYIMEAKRNYAGNEIFYIGKFVDDILGVMQDNIIDDLEKGILRNGGSLKLKRTMENENGEIEYLNMTIGRKCDNDGNDKITIRWFQKDYYARRILDYHSSHPLRMKQKVCEEYILSALRITDSIFWPDTIGKLRKVLHDSNYPNRFINSRFWNVSRHDLVQSMRRDHVYIGFPFCQDVFMRAKTMIKNLRLKRTIILAPEIMSGMRRRIFSNLKCRTGLESMVNTSATVSCNNCKFRCNVSTSSQNLKRTIAWLKDNDRFQIGKHFISFPNHSLNQHVKNVRTYKSKRDLQLMSGCTI